MSNDYPPRHRNVTAVLGPTNTGKTHLAIERMLGHESGMIGLPLRLLAREVYDKIVGKIGAEKVALVTGEEKIKPEGARYWVATVEAMPREVTVDFLAIDEIQLAADPERGHVFTDRMLHARGQLETLMLGAGTMRDAITDIVNGANFIARPRLSKLTYSGEKKITRLPKRTAIVTFSANDVYAIAELIRRQLGGTAVVLGALSPRTRNAQVALYQAGDVDYMVATDAIGMGLNLDVNHVAFAAVRKFDGQNFRNLTPSELAQIAGRAGRHMSDGTFGVTGDVEPFDHDLVERLETHTFDPLKTLQWRSRNLDFASVDALRESLKAPPRQPRLARARMADDLLALETVSHDRELMELADGRDAVTLLWDVCQVPDYRKISSQNHAELIAQLFRHLRTGDGHLPEDWFSGQVEHASRTDGDIDTLSNRLAHIRTWTFVANRAAWLKDPEAWQARTRAIEDALSDALHECLTQRFVDKRTSALMKGLRDKEELSTAIGGDGAIHVENHFVGRLKGFVFQPETGETVEGVHAKATRSAVAVVLGKELTMRARRVASAKNDAFRLNRQGKLSWRGEEIGRLEASDNPLKPNVVLFSDEHLQPSDKEKVQARLDTWLADTLKERLGPLVQLAAAEDVSGLARGIAFRLMESFGILKREPIAEEVKALDQPSRGMLRQYGVKFGAFNIFFPMLLKPAAAELATVLWALKHAGEHGLTLETLPEPPRAGLTSAANDGQRPEALYRVGGYHVCGPRAVRIDILERLDNLIRPLITFRSKAGSTDMPPKGATGDGAFIVTPEMMSILGCSPDEVGNVLRSLGFRSEKRKARPKPIAPAAAAAVAQTPSEPPAAAEAGMAAPGEPPTDAAPAPVEAEAAAPEVATETSAEAAAAVPVATEAASEGPTATSESSEAPAPVTGGEAAPAEAAAAEVVVEEVFEEVWRPRRRGPPPGAERRHDRQHDRQREGEPASHRRSRHGHKFNRGPHAPGQPAAAAGTAPVAQAPAASGDAAAPVAAAPASASTAGAGPGQQRKPWQGKPRDQRGDRRPRGERRDEGERKPQRYSSGPAQKSGPDPDSPFAALNALKLAYEKQSREGS